MSESTKTTKNPYKNIKSQQAIAVVVLGDLDRSPRMVNHAVEAAQWFERVTLIGYQGSSMQQGILDNNGIQVTYLSVWLIDKLRKLPRFLYLIYAMLRIIIQVVQLFWHLLLVRLTSKPYDYLLIQNPPCLPLLFVAVVVGLLTCGRTRVIIDWHNYGFSILKVGGSNKYLVSIAKWYELFFGKMGWRHLTVSQAMKTNLIELVGMRAEDVFVLYDCATNRFKSLTQDEKLAMYHKISLPQLCETNRPAMLLSSTSYTPDEDFMVLVNALDIVDKNIKAPKIQVLVTGRGPMKAQYEQIFRQRNSVYTRVNIRQVWLHADEYPQVVASADLGVCLHQSSSGFDLPMKVVDMFSAGLPCLAIGGYPSLPELVKDNENGRVFYNSEELAEQITKVLEGYLTLGPKDDLTKYRKNLISFKDNTWSKQWQKVMAGTVFNL